MNLLSLILLAVETVGSLASNPNLGLGTDGTRIAALLSLIAKLGRKGEEAIPELQAFTEEVKAILERGERVDLEVWDAMTARRHADLDRIRDAAQDPEGP